MAHGARVESFGRGEIIVRQGDKGDTCYIIKSGGADVVLRDSSGKEGLIATLGAGNFFGEMSLLTGEPRSADVSAREDTVCVVIDSRAFKTIFTDNPDMAELMSEVLVRRIHELEDVRLKTALTASTESDIKKNTLQRIRHFFKLDK